MARSRRRHGGGAMTTPVLEAITKQIANEFGASFSYLAMAGWCEHHKFMGAGLAAAAEPGRARARDEAVQFRARAQPSGAPARHRAATKRVRVDRGRLRAGAGAGAGSQPADRRASTSWRSRKRSLRPWPSCSGSSPSRSKRRRPFERLSPSSTWSSDDPASLLDLDRELGARRPRGDGRRPT